MSINSIFQFPEISKELLQIWRESLLKLLSTPSEDSKKMETLRATGKSLVLTFLEKGDSWKIGSDPCSAEVAIPKSPVQKENVAPAPEVYLRRNRN
ncbi:hypothetical protein GCK72_007100 [Caenorhabditis remanei]|uniref:Uncharacterized protein n=1 Tax=Caenorhabditis remanei TaxID=31234 RepID=A0A6A5HJ20_CAERE|nr:hypothetical protein GCK72_007100 [Caenorhabditis remanei]KAF1767141.1 hypothetical protein GCK72_007100 [Caenorhabditis remanei]